MKFVTQTKVMIIKNIIFIILYIVNVTFKY